VTHASAMQRFDAPFSFPHCVSCLESLLNEFPATNIKTMRSLLASKNIVLCRFLLLELIQSFCLIRLRTVSTALTVVSSQDDASQTRQRMSTQNPLCIFKTSDCFPQNTPDYLNKERQIQSTRLFPERPAVSALSLLSCFFKQNDYVMFVANCILP